MKISYIINSFSVCQTVVHGKSLKYFKIEKNCTGENSVYKAKILKTNHFRIFKNYPANLKEKLHWESR